MSAISLRARDLWVSVVVGDVMVVLKVKPTTQNNEFAKVALSSTEQELFKRYIRIEDGNAGNEVNIVECLRNGFMPKKVNIGYDEDPNAKLLKCEINGIQTPLLGQKGFNGTYIIERESVQTSPPSIHYAYMQLNVKLKEFSVKSYISLNFKKLREQNPDLLPPAHKDKFNGIQTVQRAVTFNDQTFDMADGDRVVCVFGAPDQFIQTNKFAQSVLLQWIEAISKTKFNELPVSVRSQAQSAFMRNIEAKMKKDFMFTPTVTTISTDREPYALKIELM